MLVSAFLDATSHQLWERQVVWCPSALLEQYVVGRAKTFRGLPTADSAPFSATPFRTVIARMPVSTRSFFRVLTHDQVSPGSNVELASSSLTVAVRYRSDLRSSSASTCRLQPARRRHCRSVNRLHSHLFAWAISPSGNSAHGVSPLLFLSTTCVRSGRRYRSKNPAVAPNT